MISHPMPFNESGSPGLRPRLAKGPRPSGIPRAISMTANRFTVAPNLDKLLAPSQLAAYRQSGRYPRARPALGDKNRGDDAHAQARVPEMPVPPPVVVPEARRRPTRPTVPRPKKMIIGMTDENTASVFPDFDSKRRSRTFAQLNRNATAPGLHNQRHSASFRPVSIIGDTTTARVQVAMRERKRAAQNARAPAINMNMPAFEEIDNEGSAELDPESTHSATLPEVKPLAIKRKKRGGVLLVNNDTAPTPELASLPTQILIHTPPVPALKTHTNIPYSPVPSHLRNLNTPKSAPSSPAISRDSSARPPSSGEKYIWTMMDEVRLVRNGGVLAPADAPIINPHYRTTPLFQRPFTGLPWSPVSRAMTTLRRPEKPDPSPTSFRASISRLIGVRIQNQQRFAAASPGSNVNFSSTPTGTSTPMQRTTATPPSAIQAQIRRAKTLREVGTSPINMSPIHSDSSTPSGSSPHWVVVDPPSMRPTRPSGPKNGAAFFRAMRSATH